MISKEYMCRMVSSATEVLKGKKIKWTTATSYNT